MLHYNFPNQNKSQKLNVFSELQFLLGIFFNYKEIKSENEELQTGYFIKVLKENVVRLTEKAVHSAM